MNIRGYNILAEPLHQFVLWVVDDGHRVHAFMRRGIDVFDREPWFIDGYFEDDQSALAQCLAKIEEHVGPIERVNRPIGGAYHDR